MGKTFLFWGSLALTFFCFAALSFLLNSNDKLFLITNLVLAFIAIVLTFFKELRLKNFIKLGSSSFYYLITVTVALAVYLSIFQFNYRIDLSNKQVTKLTADTLELIERVKSPIKVSVVSGVKNFNLTKFRYLKNLVEKNSDRIRFELIDPAKQLALVDGKWKLIPGEVMILEDLDGKFVKTDLLNEESFRESLEVLTGKLASLVIVDPDQLLKIDNTADGFKRFTEILQQAGYTYQIQEQLPEDPSKLTIILPYQNKFGSFEKLQRALILLDPLHGVAGSELLSPDNLNWNQVVILEQADAQNPNELVWQVNNKLAEPHPITSNIKDLNSLIYLVAGSYQITNTSSCKSLFKTSATSWGESNISDLLTETPKANKDASDIIAEQSTAVACRDNSATVISYADIEWLRNANIDLQSHRRILLNSLRFIEQKTIYQQEAATAPEIKLLSSQTYRLLLLIAFVACELIIIAGLVVSYFRHKKKSV